jgi:CheY-like chemotaxis protein
MSASILLVDDNEVFRRPLQRVLEAAGFEVTAVPSAGDALDALDGRTVDVLLTDQRLPGMDGVQLIARIRATHPALAYLRDES